MNSIFTRRGLRAAAGLLAALALCSCSKSEPSREPEPTEEPKGAFFDQVKAPSDSDQAETPSDSKSVTVEEPEYIGDLKEVLTNQREFRFIDANDSSSEANPSLAKYNSEVHMTLLRDIERQITSADVPVGPQPVSMTVLDMDMDGKVEVILSLDTDNSGRWGWLTLHWEDGVVYGYYHWYRWRLDSIDEAGILVRGGIFVYDPSIPGAYEAALKEYYDHYFYYFEFNGPEFATHQIGFCENPYCDAPDTVWNDCTPENIELFVTHSAAETAVQYPRDALTRNGDGEEA